ncbi:hypothetical protein TNCV_135131 [Trichonephila clavipes]|nr:hypothetical protein TNCV_135131 [Trichonephila clavipes]
MIPKQGKGEIGEFGDGQIEFHTSQRPPRNHQDMSGTVSGTVVTHVGAPVAWEPRIIDTAVAKHLSELLFIS